MTPESRFAFGLALLIAAYTIGPISGCHINPAVTLAMWITRKIPTRTLPAYIIGQIIGAFAGAR
jgi:aquaporin Z